MKYTTVSRQAAIRLLVQDGFTESEAIYGVDHSAADWYAQAVKAAKEYLSVSVSSYDQMIRLLVTGGFTEDQASYGAAHCGKKW